MTRRKRTRANLGKAWTMDNIHYCCIQMRYADHWREGRQVCQNMGLSKDVFGILIEYPQFLTEMNLPHSFDEMNMECLCPQRRQYTVKVSPYMWHPMPQCYLVSLWPRPVLQYCLATVCKTCTECGSPHPDATDSSSCPNPQNNLYCFPPTPVHVNIYSKHSTLWRLQV